MQRRNQSQSKGRGVWSGAKKIEYAPRLRYSHIG
jgi:hypothetical protein